MVFFFGFFLIAANEKQQAEEIYLARETQGMDIRPVEICALVWWVQILDPCHVFVRHRKGEWMVSTCMVPTVEEVWWCGCCLAGETVGDLFKIEGTLNQHGYHSILQPHAISSGLCLVGSFIFQQDNGPQTHLQAV